MDLFGTTSNPYSLSTDVSQSNLAASPYITQLDQLVNSLNQSAQQTANMSRISGEAGLEQQSSNDISSELAGQLNPGTVSTIQDSMAQLYGGNGFGADNAATSAAAERAMGLTAEGQVQAGEGNLSAAAARNPAAPIYDASNLLVTPNQYLSAQQASGSGTGTGGVKTGTGGASSIPSPTQGNQNFGGATGGTYTTPTAATTAGTGATSYTPGGSSPFGLIDTGNGNTLDMFDSSGLYSNGVMSPYGTMPDYSQPTSYLNNVPGAPTIANSGDTTPANTVYSPATDTYNYNFGLPNYNTSGNVDYTGYDPASTYNAGNDSYGMDSSWY